MFQISMFQLGTNKKHSKSLVLIKPVAAGYKYLHSGWKFMRAQAPNIINHTVPSAMAWVVAALAAAL